MPGLTAIQSSQIYSLYPQTQEIYCSGIVRLYSSIGYSWEYTGICGPASLLIENNIYYARIGNLNDKQIYFEQELYDGFSFKQPLPFFITFEGSSCVYGLSFAVEDESATFAENLAICVDDLSGERHSTKPTSVNSTAPTSIFPTSVPISTMPPGLNEIPDSKATKPKLSIKLSPFKLVSSINTKSETKKQKRRGLFGRSKKKQPEIVISTPTEFQHNSHIGWNLEKGFDIHNIPLHWKQLFEAAGITENDLDNTETRQLISSTINSVTEETSGNTYAAPPPPPPTSNAPPTSSVSNGTGGLLSGLQAGKVQLQSAGERSIPNTSSVSNTQVQSLAETLAEVIDRRRKGIDAKDNDEEDEWSDDWSDDWYN